MYPVKEQLRSGTGIDTVNLFKHSMQGNSRTLYLLERGRVAQIEGEEEVSRAEYAACDADLAQEDDEAVLTARGTASQGIASVLNDRVLRYRAEPYERVFLHHFQAQNYLMSGDVSGALVEVRKADAIQRQIVEKRGMADGNPSSYRDDRDVDRAMPAVLDAYAGLDEIAGVTKASFLNPYTFYLSGLCYELSGNLNDAYIDYKRALELVPTNTVVQKDVIRLASEFGMRQDLAELTKRFPDTAADVALLPPDHGTVVIFVEQGFVPVKETLFIPIPLTGAVSVVTIAMPIYRHGGETVPEITLRLAPEWALTPQPLCEVTGLAVQSLRDRVKELATRQILRAVAKGVAAKAAHDEFGIAGSVLAGWWNVVSERADLRSWTTLPAKVDIARAMVPAGDHTFSLGADVRVHAKVREKSTTLIILTQAGEHIYVNSHDFCREPN